jgi:hypothetical protein
MSCDATVSQERVTSSSPSSVRLSETDYVLRHLPLLSTNGRPCSSNTWKLGFNMQPLVRAGTSTSVNPFVAKLIPCEISNKDIASRHTYSRSKIAFIVSCTFFHDLRFAAPSNLLRQYQYLPYFLLISCPFLHRLIHINLRGIQNCANY